MGRVGRPILPSHGSHETDATGYSFTLLGVQVGLPRGMSVHPPRSQVSHASHGPPMGRVGRRTTGRLRQVGQLLGRLARPVDGTMAHGRPIVRPMGRPTHLMDVPHHKASNGPTHKDAWAAPLFSWAVQTFA